MKHEDIIRLAIEHTIHGLKFDEEGLVRFANLVAQHTQANIDPSSFMSYQEGFEAGRLSERAFDDWWDTEYDGTKNPFTLGTPAYWAWAGWQAALKAREQA